MFRVIILLSALTAASASELPPGYYDHWFEEVEVLSTPEERRLFQSLGSDAEREAFIRRFWMARDPYPDVPGNRVRERWLRHHQLAGPRIDVKVPPEIRELAKLPVAAGWTESFRRSTTSMDTEVRSLPAHVEIRFPGQHLEQTVLEVRLLLGRKELLGERTKSRVELASEILHQGRIHDRARWTLVLESDLTETSIPLGFFRGVDRGSTHLVLRLAQPESGRHYLSVVPLDPPASSRDLSMGFALPNGYHLLGAGGLEFVLGAHHLEILDLEPGPKILQLEVRAAARGPRLAGVEWRLEGEVVALSQSAPYTAMIELGRLPVRRWLEAVAVDRDKTLLARDRVLLNGGPHRLALRLVEPQPGSSYQGSVPIRAVVERPVNSVLREVEFFVNDRPIATRLEVPFEVEAQLDDSLSMIRAVATLDDGRTAEDIVVVNSPGFIDDVDVDLVELFVSVRDRQDRPVRDLTAGELEVREAGVAQALEKFERIENLPIHVLLAVDSSESMAQRMPQARGIAEEFLRRVVGPKDQAALLAFNHLPQMLGDFTNNADLLAERVAGLHAEGGTALYDSVVYSLFQFGGLNGKRALVLISDGYDQHSRFRAKEAIEFAKRTGVAVYTLAVGSSAFVELRPGRGARTRQLLAYLTGLRTLAEATGGLSFSVANDRELAEALARIEEDLRSQYFLAYISPGGERGVFRELEVEVLRPGLEARTIQGYFPGEP